jgi:hypothetical protein
VSVIIEPQLTKSFRQWLDEQPSERKREIRAAERRFLDGRRTEHAEQGYAGDPLEQAYEESFFGYSEIA